MKNSILYLECHSGISGDMTVAALLDLGADRDVLSAALASLPLSGYSVEIKDVFKSGIRACDFHVILDEEHENHDHDMVYLYGDTASSETQAISDTRTHISYTQAAPDANTQTSYTQTAPDTDIQTSHTHNKNNHEHHHNHSHHSRNLQDIISIIRAGQLTANAAKLAIRIFEILAEAEAKVHGKGINEVHFHEVGAVDSIVDIVAAAVCLDNLRPDQVIVSPLTEGCGQIRCQHGLIPIPVPAVTAIAEQNGLVLKLTDISGELVTPTGAAIAAAVRSGDKLPNQFQILKTGHGAGKRDYATAGFLRAMLIEETFEEECKDGSASHDDCDTVLVLETNIDDCTGEALAYTMQQLMATGALDVFYVPIYMKKNRPAYLLKTICNQEDRETLETIIFQNTTTIGIRRQVMQRTKLRRQIISMQTPWGTADIKCCEYNGMTRFYPENDSVSRLAAENKTGFAELYGQLRDFARNHLTFS
ncbi:MAG: nickel pincer cofactor biosynthesis protein LarC [Lachnospiraceae bacterium]|nr:nickel pincer cofactor biosynthesis protein LarC [Lachnospiraceae bacterium]